MLAYLSVVNNPNDALRLRRIINEPKRGIGDATVSTAGEIGETLGIPLFEVLAWSRKTTSRAGGGWRTWRNC